MSAPLRAPFPWFGGKRDVAEVVWSRLGRVKHYIEPFCGSAAVLLAAPQPAALEVIGDTNLYVANFWRAVRAQPDEVFRWADYPVSHIDLYARHQWLTRPGIRRELVASLLDADHPGDAKVAGWWVWGLCSWIGSGWCDREVRKVPHVGNAGMGDLSAHQQGARAWIRRLAARLERVRIIHGSWDRTLNVHYGGDGPGVGVFLDPPYRDYEALYATDSARPVALEVAEWARANQHLRVVLAGHDGDYDLPEWEQVPWARKRLTYSGDSTTNREVLWCSPACLRPTRETQATLFGSTP